MSYVVVESTRYIGAVFLVGIVIKLIDDHLDQSVSHEPGRDIAAYLVLLFAVAVSLAPAPACTLFFAAYVVGMVKDPNLILPTRLPTWGESLLVICGGMLLWPYPEMLSSITIMTAVQLGDDYVDQELDHRENRHNLVQQWGKIEVLLSVIITGLISLLVDGKKLLVVFLLTPLINYLFQRNSKERGAH